MTGAFMHPVSAVSESVWIAAPFILRPEPIRYEPEALKNRPGPTVIDREHHTPKPSIRQQIVVTGNVRPYI